MVRIKEVEMDKVNIESAFSFKGDYLPHIKVTGISGSGKSTLVSNLVLRYIESGQTVVWREMGKYDLVSRFQKVSDIIDWLKSGYEGKDVDDRIEFWEDYKYALGEDFITVISHPLEIQERKVNILAWDILPECVSKEVLIQQYYEFMRILREQREDRWQELPDLAFFIDEANHIMPTYTKNPFKLVTNLIREMVQWMTQWRGYHVRLVLTTHSLEQLNNDARDQCQLSFWKRIPRKNAKALLQHELFYLEDADFVNTFKRILSLRTDEVLYIDDRNVFKFMKVPWIEKKYTADECRKFILSFEPRPIIKPIRYSWKGAWDVAKSIYVRMTEEDKRRVFLYKEEDGIILVKRHQLYEMTFRDPELKILFGNHDFFHYVESAILVMFENYDAAQIFADFIARKETRKAEEEDLMEVIYHEVKAYQEKKKTLQEAIFAILNFKKLSSSRIAAIFDISEYRARKIIARWKLEQKDREIASKKT